MVSKGHIDRTRPSARAPWGSGEGVASPVWGPGLCSVNVILHANQYILVLLKYRFGGGGEKILSPQYFIGGIVPSRPWAQPVVYRVVVLASLLAVALHCYDLGVTNCRRGQSLETRCLSSHVSYSPVLVGDRRDMSSRIRRRAGLVSGGVFP